MWITFKSCIFAFWNNFTMMTATPSGVVNYIQILYLCILKQPGFSNPPLFTCCELHSNLVSLHSETTSWLFTNASSSLWITFKSCIFAFWNNAAISNAWLDIVVNYIQILYLCILKQRGKSTNPCHVCCELHSNLVSLHSETTCFFGEHLLDRCELHSNLVSLHSETTCIQLQSLKTKLWITFKSCIFAFWNNITTQSIQVKRVVNYIQILYLCILKQLRFLSWCGNRCCELHSNLVSLHSETTLKDKLPHKESCELHSNLVSLHSETTVLRWLNTMITLWITFKSCIFAFWNNWCQLLCSTSMVVNYIQILYLCILKQRWIPIVT